MHDDGPVLLVPIRVSHDCVPDQVSDEDIPGPQIRQIPTEASWRTDIPQGIGNGGKCVTGAVAAHHGVPQQLIAVDQFLSVGFVVAGSIERPTG